MNADTGGIVIIYDGECPFCSSYVSMLKLRESTGEVTLLNARDNIETYKPELINLNLDLDEGMAIKYQGQWFHGAEGIHLLAMLTQDKGVLNQLQAFLFRSRYVSRVLYPIMRFFRNLTLKMLGRSKLGRL